MRSEIHQFGKLNGKLSSNCYNINLWYSPLVKCGVNIMIYPLPEYDSLFLRHKSVFSGQCLINLMPNPLLTIDQHLGQHNFEFRYVSRMRWDVVGQPSSLFHILERMGVENSKLRWGRFRFTFKNRWEMWNRCNFRVITVRGQGISIWWPCKAGDTDLTPKLCWP